MCPPALGVEEARSLAMLRRDLHRHPELSGREERTAAVVARTLAALNPARLERGLGGHGVLAVFSGEAAGARVLVRCELDALPVRERPEMEHASVTPGVAHKCGHDGHMAMALGLARLLSDSPPPAGEVTILFQPAEETGEGASMVLADPRFAAFEPDLVLAIHNLPGFPMGEVVLRPGIFASASVGLVVRLRGSTSHASEPHHGVSPAAAMAALITALEAAPQRHTDLAEAAQATVVHGRLGQRALGTSPGVATVIATLRAHQQEVAERLVQTCSRMARGVARAHGLACRISLEERFPSTVNDPGVVASLETMAAELGAPTRVISTPFPWSEDFGHFTGRWPGALVGLGSGVDTPHLHSPLYDFPDQLIPKGAALLHRFATGLAARGSAG